LALSHSHKTPAGRDPTRYMARVSTARTEIRIRVRGTVLLVFCAISTNALAGAAVCTIKIEDAGGADYSVAAKFDAAPSSGQRKSFKTPGANYSCTLVFFGLGKGTSLACAFDGDMQETYFQSDRSTQQDPRSDNYLTFRHRGSHFVISSKCERTS